MYEGLSEEDIRALSREELIDAVLRMFKVHSVRAEKCLGDVMLPDSLADAFRGRR